MTRSDASVPRGPLGRRHRLRARRDLQRVFRRGRRAHGPHLSVITADAATGLSRLGLAVSKRAGNSPRRSRLKRLLREAFRATRHRWPALDVMAICNKPWPAAKLAEVAAEMDMLVERSQARRRTGRR